MLPMNVDDGEGEEKEKKDRLLEKDERIHER
jgi:hypothetical protein